MSQVLETPAQLHASFIDTPSLLNRQGLLLLLLLLLLLACEGP
jgi:hypothetical protein